MLACLATVLWQAKPGQRFVALTIADKCNVNAVAAQGLLHPLMPSDILALFRLCRGVAPPTTFATAQRACRWC